MLKNKFAISRLAAVLIHLGITAGIGWEVSRITEMGRGQY